MLLNCGRPCGSPLYSDVTARFICPITARRTEESKGRTGSTPHLLLQNSARGAAISASATTVEVVPATKEKQIDKALEHASLGYSFTPGGLLFPYYTGVISALTDLDLMGPDTVVSGTSAGAVAVAMIASGLDIDDIMEHSIKFQSQMLEKGTLWKLADMLKTTLMDMLPDDVHLRMSGRAGIAVTKYKGKTIEGVVIEHFFDKEDFADAVVASCYIPYYLGPRSGIPYRGDIYSDGMVTNFYPPLPRAAQEAVKRIVTVSALPKTNRSFFKDPGVDVCPDLRPRSKRYSTLEYIKIGLIPCQLDKMREIAEDGYSDAKQWGEKYLEQCTRKSEQTL